MTVAGFTQFAGMLGGFLPKCFLRDIVPVTPENGYKVAIPFVASARKQMIQSEGVGSGAEHEKLDAEYLEAFG